MNNLITLPKSSILEIELIINDKLLEEELITIEQHDEVMNVIYKKMSQIKS